MKEIQLTQGQVALVDDEDYEYLSQWKWYARWNKSTQSYYAVRTVGTKPNQVTVRMHRFIMNTLIGMDCDHKDHDTLNNQKHNLRNATKSQNSVNRKLRPDNKLKEKCISPSGKGYLVQIKRNKMYVFSKWFRDLGDAVDERNNAIDRFRSGFEYGAGEK
jgi:hypothetical protein